MKTFRQICGCALLAALTGLVVCAMVLVRAATTVVAGLPGQVDATRAALVGEVRGARGEVLARGERQMAALRRETLAEVERMRATVEQRAGDALARVDAAVAVADALRQDVQPVLGAARATLAESSRTVADLHPQLLGLVAASKVTAGETAQTMRDVRDAVPGFVTQGQTISSNVGAATREFSAVAANLNRLTKPKWYDRLLGYGLNGVMLYRNLNPATNLTVTGARLAASRP